MQLRKHKVPGYIQYYTGMLYTHLARISRQQIQPQRSEKIQSIVDQLWQHKVSICRRVFGSTSVQVRTQPATVGEIQELMWQLLESIRQQNEDWALARTMYQRLAGYECLMRGEVESGIRHLRRSDNIT
eukprot:TRINITY_DN7681_c0_g1_i1.p1 TRINITY_DN7681_c0_g1~~TRINITY_DN7681_c0_g1_i1.p1  ORF type:complete len:129 (+),score=9.69 TRINITY_DN7681_c0_g1_i1:161-547(+)